MERELLSLTAEQERWWGAPGHISAQGQSGSSCIPCTHRLRISSSVNKRCAKGRWLRLPCSGRRQRRRHESPIKPVRKGQRSIQKINLSLADLQQEITWRDAGDNVSIKEVSKHGRWEWILARKTYDSGGGTWIQPVMSVISASPNRLSFHECHTGLIYSEVIPMVSLSQYVQKAEPSSGSHWKMKEEISPAVLPLSSRCSRERNGVTWLCYHDLDAGRGANGKKKNLPRPWESHLLSAITFLIYKTAFIHCIYFFPESYRYTEGVVHLKTDLKRSVFSPCHTL